MFKFILFFLLMLMFSLNELLIFAQTNKFQSTEFNTNIKKSEFLLFLAKSYSCNAYSILQQSDFEYYTKWATGKSHYQILGNYAAVIHETCHSINNDIGGFWSFGYFISPDIQIKVNKSNVFKSSELDKLIPEDWKTKIFRYKTYLQSVDENEEIASVEDGIYGIMDEFVAYYQSTRSVVELFNYYKTIASGKDPYYWCLYISTCYSAVFAYYEFRLIIAWYLKYAKANYPEIYTNILKNRKLKVVFTLIDSNYSKVVDRYFSKRNYIVDCINKAGVKKADLSDNFIYIRPAKNNGNSNGYGIPDGVINYLKSLFTSEDLKMLKLLTIDNLNEINYQKLTD